MAWQKRADKRNQLLFKSEIECKIQNKNIEEYISQPENSKRARTTNGRNTQNTEKRAQIAWRKKSDDRTSIHGGRRSHSIFLPI